MLQALIPSPIRHALSRRFDRAISKRMRPASTVQKLESRSIYILPTRYGIVFACVLYVMLMGSINYSNSMGFMLTFLLTGIALIGMLYTYRNLAPLKLTAGRAKPVFAGDQAEFPIHAQTTHGRPTYRIAIGLDRSHSKTVDIGSLDAASTKIPMPAPKRGRMKLGRLKVQTSFPLGWFRAWSWVAVSAEVLVYPHPAGNRRLPTSTRIGDGGKQAMNKGHEDFAGIRRYQPSDSPKHIAWKALARGHDVLTKQFSDHAGDEVWLEWDSLSDLSTEQRLSQICQWVLTLNQQGQRYGLRLPGTLIKPDSGEQQRTACLEALALYGS